MMGSSFRVASKDIELAQPPSDSVSKIDFSPTQDVLAVASWDNNVRLYNVSNQGQNEPKHMYNHEAPVLDLCWTKNGSHLFSAGCDNAVQMFDMTSMQKQQVAGHDAPIKCVRYIEVNGQQVLVTAGWDKKMKYWDLRSPNPMNVQDLSDRAYAMDATDKIAVVGTADRLVHIYDLSNPFTKYRQVESPLKWQTRVISCFPHSVTGENGYAIGSIEGRVGFQYTHTNDDKKSFSFKCHRVDIPAGSMGAPATTGSQNVFPINTITFHKIQGTFCTGGGDGSITFWDGVARTKLKTFSAKDLQNGDTEARPPVWGTPIVSTSFNHSCDILAYAMSYDWSKGHGGVPPAGNNPTKIMLHMVKPDEVTRKKK
jgi:mRNA export factor